MSDDADDRAVRARFTARSEAETIALATQLGPLLPAGAWIALSGELGAGKTRFVKGLARGMGLDETRVASPTFVLLHVYEASVARDSATTLAHVDAYRMTGASELDSLGLDALLAERCAVVAVEWAERIADALPDDALRVRIDHAPESENARTITMEGADDVWRDAIARLRAGVRKDDAHA